MTETPEDKIIREAKADCWYACREMQALADRYAALCSERDNNADSICNTKLDDLLDDLLSKFFMHGDQIRNVIWNCGEHLGDACGRDPGGNFYDVSAILAITNQYRLHGILRHHPQIVEMIMEYLLGDLLFYTHHNDDPPTADDLRVPAIPDFAFVEREISYRIHLQVLACGVVRQAGAAKPDDWEDLPQKKAERTRLDNALLAHAVQHCKDDVLAAVRKHYRVRKG